MKANDTSANLNPPSCRWAESRLSACVIVMVAGLAALAAPSAQAQTYQVLYTFSGGNDGGEPYAGVILDEAGNLYGTTYLGGATNLPQCDYSGQNGCGVVFKLDATGKETVLYTFQGLASGTHPWGGLLLDKKGNLYGTTSGGGNVNCDPPYGCGTVFRINTAGHERQLYSFAGENDGKAPQASLIQDAAGNLYGTTTAGQTQFTSGTVFKLDATGKETVLHIFTGTPDGGWPSGSLLRDAHGNLVGTTSYGGDGTECAFGCGAVFKITPTGQESVLYSFTGGADGLGPVGNPIRDSAGDLYGVTASGGDLSCVDPYGCGVVFKMDAAGVETVLYAFADETNNGFDPNAGVVRDAAGNFYGTTYRGGAYGKGTVYKVDASGNETLLYSFTGGADGGYPPAGLSIDASGNLYGTNLVGGNMSGCGGGGCGVVFKIVP